MQNKNRKIVLIALILEKESHMPTSIGALGHPEHQAEIIAAAHTKIDEINRNRHENGLEEPRLGIAQIVCYDDTRELIVPGPERSKKANNAWEVTIKYLSEDEA